MGILAEYPKCRNRNSLKKNRCLCGCNIKKAAGKTYWVEYYIGGKRKRERIGPSKIAAENRYRQVLKARTEEKYIDLDKSSTMTLSDLTSWYLELFEVKNKKSYTRDNDFVGHILRLLGASTIVKNITPGIIENYRQLRLAEKSPRRKGENIKSATVNKEVSCLGTIFNRAIRYGKLRENPVRVLKRLPENNVRMKVLKQDEFEALYSNGSSHLKPVILTAYLNDPFLPFSVLS